MLIFLLENTAINILHLKYIKYTIIADVNTTKSQVWGTRQMNLRIVEAVLRIEDSKHSLV